MKIYKKHMLEKYGITFDKNASVDDFITTYIKEKQARVAIVYPQQMHFINLSINSYCNLACYSCDQFVDSAPAKREEEMSLQQIKDFVEESQKLQWKWDEIRVTGGEPSLHPQFKEILKVLSNGLKHTYLPDITLKIISNGTGKKVRKILDIDNAALTKFNRVTDGFYLNHIGHPDWSVVCSKPLKDTVKKTFVKDFESIEKEVELIPDFGNVWLAPVDRLQEINNMHKGKPGDIASPPVDGYYPPNLNNKQKKYIEENNIIMDCQIHASCGFELSRYGYSPCGGGGGRVIGNQEQFFGSLSEITLDECNKRLAKLCATCGQNMNYTIPCSKRTEKTEFWELILKNYIVDKPKMNLYDPFKRQKNNEN